MSRGCSPSRIHLFRAAIHRWPIWFGLGFGYVLGNEQCNRLNNRLKFLKDPKLPDLVVRSLARICDNIRELFLPAEREKQDNGCDEELRAGERIGANCSMYSNRDGSHFSCGISSANEYFREAEFIGTV